MVQNRLPNPRMKLLGTYYWPDGGRAAQQPTPMRIKGRPYICVRRRETRRGSPVARRATSRSAWARLIDILERRSPCPVSYLMLASKPGAPTRRGETRGYALPDRVPATSSRPGGFLYDAHYCTADDPEERQDGGVQLHAVGRCASFDVRDPYHAEGSRLFRFASDWERAPPGSTLWWTTSADAEPDARSVVVQRAVPAQGSRRVAHDLVHEPPTMASSWRS